MSHLGKKDLLFLYIYNRLENRKDQTGLNRIKRDLKKYMSRPMRFKFDKPYPALDIYIIIVEKMHLIRNLENKYLKSYLSRFDSSESSDSDESSSEGTINETILAVPDPPYFGLIARAFLWLRSLFWA